MFVEHSTSSAKTTEKDRKLYEIIKNQDLFSVRVRKFMTDFQSFFGRVEVSTVNTIHISFTFIIQIIPRLYTVQLYSTVVFTFYKKYRYKNR